MTDPIEEFREILLPEETSGRFKSGTSLVCQSSGTYSYMASGPKEVSVLWKKKASDDWVLLAQHTVGDALESNLMIQGNVYLSVGDMIRTDGHNLTLTWLST